MEVIKRYENIRLIKRRGLFVIQKRAGVKYNPGLAVYRPVYADLVEYKTQNAADRGFENVIKNWYK